MTIDISIVNPAIPAVNKAVIYQYASATSQGRVSSKTGGDTALQSRSSEENTLDLFSANQAVIYQGVSATLQITLTNNTGGDITLQTGSSLEVWFPKEFFEPVQLEAMQINPMDGWSSSWNEDDSSWMLTRDIAGYLAWESGTSLQFPVTNVCSSASPATGQLQINPANMSCDVPRQIDAVLTLMLQPTPGNLNLKDNLELMFDSKTIYVSDSMNSVANALVLNLKNIGTNPLYSGKKMWSVSPCATMYFLYGLEPGALAPDDDKQTPSSESVWKIKAEIKDSQGNEWKVTNPRNSDPAPHPSWKLEPENINKEIIGKGAHANITFSLSNIYSFIAPGHTQMYVLFSGFPADDTHRYNDALYVLDIIKEKHPLEIHSFRANPNEIGQGQSSTLSWEVLGATSCQLTYDLKTSTVMANGSLVVLPTQTTKYALYATDGVNEMEQTIDVLIGNVEIKQFQASTQGPITAGDEVTLTWDTLYASRCTLDLGKGITEVTSSGFVNQRPDKTTTYSLLCTGLNGPVSRSIKVEIRDVKIKSFGEIPHPQGAMLKWDTQYANKIMIDNGVGECKNDYGSTIVTPAVTTKYTLTCYGGNGPVSEYVWVEVKKRPL